MPNQFQMEDESTTYLSYLNDPTTTSYLLSNSVELAESYPFSEIETNDWPVLLSTSLISDDAVSENINIQLCNESGSLVHSNEDIIENQECIDVNNVQGNENSGLNGYNIESNKTYINYCPIVKENPDGNKEIYLTEKDINNDASVIQLLNTDGSLITIDKSILSSLNLFKKATSCLKTSPKNVESYFTSVIANKCKLCNYLCESNKDINYHLNEKHSELVRKSNGQISLLKNSQLDQKYMIFLCSVCKLAFSDKSQLREHMIEKHQLTAVESKTTLNGEKSKLNEKKGSLRALSHTLIKQQEKARKKFRCNIKGCHVKFAKDDLREKHEQCHIGGNKTQFKCLECNEKFSIWRICTTHMWKTHKIDIGLLCCPMCNNFKSHSSLRLLNHIAIHDDEKPFLCSDCGKGFKTLSQVKNHEVLHRKSNEELPNWFVTKQCDTCQMYFANSKSLKKHIQSVHENFKPFICNICGHKTARKAMLELHLRQHTGDKPHKCPYCEYRTGDHNCLRKHIMKHMGLRKYKCPYCTYTSIQSASYKNHIKNRHPGKSGTYNCNYCSFTCINSINYFAHLKKHEASLKEKESQQNEIVRASSNYPNVVEAEDEETQNCLFSADQTIEETVDTGGITIPAEIEVPL